jgi:hypothetical protein
MPRSCRVTLALLILLTTACGGDDGGAAPPAEAPIQRLPEGWNTFEPGGETICSRGTPYRFFVRKGTQNRVVIEFRGGGACWSDGTCSLAGAIFEEEANLEYFVKDEGAGKGIYAHHQPENPLQDWHHVYIPYCTGDVHWGNAEVTYGSGASAFTIQHKGAVNVRAVLDWVYENVPAPEAVFVGGCSAGAYGSIGWAAHIRRHYESAPVYHVADCGAGVITDDFFQQSFPKWNAWDALPDFIPNLDPRNISKLSEIYTAIGNHFPDMLISQYNTIYDDNQHFYYNAMGGGDVQEWSAKMRASLTEIADATPSFRYYLAPGSVHCILPRPELYQVSSGGVPLIDWLGDAVSGKPVANVSCEPDCGSPKP